MIQNHNKIKLTFSKPLSTVSSTWANAFTITYTGQRYISDPVAPIVLTCDKLSLLDETTLLIQTPQYINFRNALGEVVVAYNQLMGSLVGPSGPVKSFTIAFNPVDLIRKYNPGLTENIKPLMVTTSKLTNINTINVASLEIHLYRPSFVARATITYTGSINP